jgi:hypothetical protein
MDSVNTTEWSWLGKTRRHTLRLCHHTLSGRQEIFLNGLPTFSTGWRFKLTGTIQIPLEDSNLEVFLLADGL